MKDMDKMPLTKLAIGVEGGFQETTKEYETTMQVVCHACHFTIPAEGYVCSFPNGGNCIVMFSIVIWVSEFYCVFQERRKRNCAPGKLKI